MAFMIQQDVVEFQIAIDDAFLVQEVEGQRYFSRVEARVLLGQSALALHVEHQVATTNEFDDEKEP